LGGVRGRILPFTQAENVRQTLLLNNLEALRLTFKEIELENNLSQLRHVRYPAIGG
jgi:hypothetical protein